MGGLGKETDHIEAVDAEAFEHVLANHPDTCVVDVRRTASSAPPTWKVHAASLESLGNHLERILKDTLFTSTPGVPDVILHAQGPRIPQRDRRLGRIQSHRSHVHSHHRFCLPEHVEVS